MSIGKLIRQYREQNKLSMQEFADKAGLSKGYISMLEKGRHPQNGKEIVPSIETVSKVARAMGITIDTLLESTDRDQPIRISTNPVYEAAAGAGRIGDGSPTDTVNGILLDDDQVCVTVKGRSMEPTLYDGDTVIVQATNVVDNSDQIALVKINGGEATLKHVEVRSDGITLIGDNVSEYRPHFYTADEVKELPVTIEGVVVRLVRDL